jgi:ATP-dependent DNA helicase PIF1
MVKAKTESTFQSYIAPESTGPTYAETKRLQLANELPSLHPAQEAVLEAVKAKQSIFFTGCAGTGKTVLLHHIIQCLPEEGTFVTASTGMAAVAIQGTTLHSFAGVGLGDDAPDALVQRVQRSKQAVKRWRSARVLMIDELSMIDAVFFDKLNYVAKEVRESSLPFGGIQLVLCGDFLQLPPVCKRGQASFAFQAKCWNKCICRVFQLTNVFRQKEFEFVTALNLLREGLCPPKTVQLLKGAPGALLCLSPLLRGVACVSGTTLFFLLFR